MTTTVLPPLRRLDETRESVPLPGPTSPAWGDPATAWRIATYWERTVSPAAHAESHPRPVHGCPGCPPATGEAPLRSSENYWREVAA